jgi:hypothetical protein
LMYFFKSELAVVFFIVFFVFLFPGTALTPPRRTGSRARGWVVVD